MQTQIKNIEKLSDPSVLSDQDLYQLCQQLGVNARKWMKKFASLLPEVENRKLHLKYGFYSVYEFAAKLGGMNHAAVTEVLRVARKVEDKPALKQLIATEGWSKVKAIVGIATTKNQKVMAKRVETMSKASLVTFAREFKAQETEGRAGAGFPQKTPTESHLTFENVSFKVSSQVALKLRIFKQKLEKQQKHPVTWNEIMLFFLELEQRHENGDCKTRKKKLKSIVARKEVQKSLPKKSSRYIPASVRHYLQEKYQGKCVFPNCKQPSQILHHTRRYLLNPNHDPDYLKPLCKAHEQIAHHGLIKNETGNELSWKMLLTPQVNTKRYQVDRRVQYYRQISLC